MKIDAQEKDLLESVERDEWKTIPGLASEVQRYREYAKATLRKDRRVNILISERDLLNIQKKAVEEGIPYQTLMSSVLHKFVSGRLKEVV